MVVNSMSYAKYERYKDSGVDWLGAIPSDWQSKKLGILLTEFSKKNNPNLPLLSITRELGVITRDMDDQESNHNFIPDDLSGYKLLKEGQFGMNKMKAWQGSYGISKYTGIVSPAYYVFDVSNEIYPNFFNIAIRSKFYVDFFGSASDGVRIGQWDLNKTRMREIPFIFPSLEQQKKIYEFLSKKIKQIYQAISLKQQQIEKLGEYKQIVIQNAVTKGLNPNVPMKDSGVEWIGDIPEHWDVKKNTHLFNKIGSGTTPTSSDLSYYDSGDINWLQTGDLNNDYIVATSRKINQKAMSKFSSLKLYDENSLVIAMYGATIGKVGLLKIKSTTNQACCVLGNSDKVFMKYIFYVMQFAKNHLISNSYGGGQPNINQDMIKNLRIPYPNLQEQEKIANYLDDLNEKIYKTSKGYQTQIDRLKEYKNILINQAVTGKIKI